MQILKNRLLDKYQSFKIQSLKIVKIIKIQYKNRLLMWILYYFHYVNKHIRLEYCCTGHHSIEVMNEILG